MAGADLDSHPQREDLRNPAQIPRHARELQQLDLLLAGYESLDTCYCGTIRKRDHRGSGLEVGAEPGEVNWLAVLFPEKRFLPTDQIGRLVLQLVKDANFGTLWINLNEFISEDCSVAWAADKDSYPNDMDRRLATFEDHFNWAHIKLCRFGSVSQCDYRETTGSDLLVVL